MALVDDGDAGKCWAPIWTGGREVCVFHGCKNENLVHVRMAKDDCGNNVHSDDIDHVHYLEIHHLMREKQLNIGYLRLILKSVHDRP
jgi:hypothetical protein